MRFEIKEVYIIIFVLNIELINPTKKNNLDCKALTQQLFF